LVIVGEEMTVDAVMEEVRADRPFYDNSGGGVTLSGGEPALQLDFAYGILAQAKAEGIHTAIETDANYPWERLARLLEVTDLVMTDIKHMDSDIHKAVTGVPNERIHANHRRLMATHVPVVFHTPVVPTVNATAAQIGAIAAYIRELADLRAESESTAPPPRLELLPFHKLAADKYRSLGLTYKAIDLTPPTKEEMAAFAEAARTHGIDVHAR
jgi:pyruvate formate lyase activating enzyme